MAKKSFNISSTLSKNKTEKEPTPELASKVPLAKKAKDFDELKEKVEAVHSEVTNNDDKPVTAPAKTKTSSAARSRKKASVKEKEVQTEKLVRLTIDTPVSMHKRLKIKSIEVGVSMRDYILRLIEKDLGKNK